MALFSVHADGPWEFLARFAAFLLLAAAVCVAFWKHSASRMAEIDARFGLVDETRSLSDGERARVQAFITTMRRRYGLEARVQIVRGVLAPPAADDKTLYLGLSTASKTAVVQLPPLVAAALGPEFATELETEHFPFYFDPRRSWRRGLVLALDLIENRLAALSAAQSAAAAAHRPPKDAP